MTFLITLFTYTFDLFIISSFFNTTLDKRKENIPSSIFYGSYLLMEVAIFINQMLTMQLSNTTSLLITSAVSFFTSFALTFLYDTTFFQRIFSSVMFQILALLGENLFMLPMSRIRPEIFVNPTEELYTPMNLGSKVTLFFLTLVVGTLWKRNFRKRTLQYTILLFTTPAISLLIMLFSPLEYIGIHQNQSFFLCIYISLAVLNIINYILLDKNTKQTEALYKLKQMERQLSYQKEKYIQLGSAYKTNRRLIHDTKKHYFMIEKHIEEGAYDKLSDYLQISIKDMETHYAEINTGNLVIDSFISNYKTVCEENVITFTPSLQVDANRIPINDYDLCVILGNLLDNALNACKKNCTCHNHINITISSNDNDMFYIHLENTYHPEATTDKAPQNDSFEHGYGLENIRKITETNHGFFKYEFGESFSLDVVIPVIDESKRLQPSL